MWFERGDVGLRRFEEGLLAPYWVMPPFNSLIFNSLISRSDTIHLGLPHSTPFFENGGEMGVCV